jgi:hypothetical protein
MAGGEDKPQRGNVLLYTKKPSLNNAGVMSFPAAGVVLANPKSIRAHGMFEGCCACQPKKYPGTWDVRRMLCLPTQKVTGHMGRSKDAVLANQKVTGHMGRSKDVEPHCALKGLTAADATNPSGKFCSIRPSSSLVTYVKYFYVRTRKSNFEVSFPLYIHDLFVLVIIITNFEYNSSFSFCGKETKPTAMPIRKSCHIAYGVASLEDVCWSWIGTVVLLSNSM